MSPIEETDTVKCGKKKTIRAQKHAVLAFKDIMSQVTETPLLLPVLIENADEILGRLEQETV
jgi:hypothetical protein